MFRRLRQQVEPESRSRSRATLAWLAAAATLATASCAGGDAAIPTSSTTTQSSPSTSTSTPAAVGLPETTAPSTAASAGREQEVVARYSAYWDARFEANQAPPNPDHAALREYATGQQLDQVISETRRNLDEGLALRARENSSARRTVRVISVEGDEAMVQECVVDDGIVYRFRSGEVVNDKVATHSVQGFMRRVDGVWKLERARLVQRWEGVAGCALAGDS